VDELRLNGVLGSRDTQEHIDIRAMRECLRYSPSRK
jgi:hypothetical protein